MENKNFTLTPTRAKRAALKIREIGVKAKTKKALKMQKIVRMFDGEQVQQVRRALLDGTLLW
jgi:anti-sigma28 factor (negative regulator of flagellin synthesis)